MDASAKSDLNDLAEAYRGVAEVEGERDRDHPPVYVVPALWTAEHVQHRLVDAFGALGRMVRRPGPSEVLNNGWPEYATEGQQEEALEESARRPTSLAIELADEALQWAMIYLEDEPCQADALQLWAWAKAHGRNIEKVLRGRRIRADALLERRRDDIEGPRIARRKEIAGAVLAWGNPQIVAAASREEADAIRVEMQRRASYQIAMEMLDVPSPLLRRSEVAPGRVMTRTYLDACRKAGAARVARALRRDRVIVR